MRSELKASCERAEEEDFGLFEEVQESSGALVSSRVAQKTKGIWTTFQ